MSRRRRILIVVAAAVLAVPAILLFVVAPLLYKPYRIPSASMEPTLKIGDRVLARKGDYEPERGDIVVSEANQAMAVTECAQPGFDPVARSQPCPRAGAGETALRFVQRIVALGGERIRIENGRAVVNGRPLDEPYTRPAEDCELCNLRRDITVPAGHVFVLGDNRGESADSRLWGPVREDAIVGPVSVRYYPVSRWGRP